MSRIVFMGTPEFAVPALQSLIDQKYDIPLVLCQPDKKKGRGQKVQFPPVKQLALDNDIEVIQPVKLKDPELHEKLKSLNADFFVVIAYGRILPKAVLDIPVKGCINIHASLLPKWRGAAPIQFSLMAGDPTTGVTTMLMDEGLDTGDMLLKEEMKISLDENYFTLGEKLSSMGASLIVKTIENFDSITPQKQDESLVSHTRLLTKEDRIIDWNRPAEDLFNLFRGLSPKPGVVSFFRNKRLMLTDVRSTEAEGKVEPGRIAEMNDQGFVVQCSKGGLQVLSCQPESKKNMLAVDFVNGYQVKVGDQLS